MPLRQTVQQQDSFNEISSKADNLLRGLDTTPSQGPASAGTHICTHRKHINTHTIAYIHTYTGHFSLTSIPVKTNPTFSLFLVSQFHLFQRTSTQSELKQSITNDHYLFYPRTTPDYYKCTITYHHPSTITKTISNTCTTPSRPPFPQH